MRRLRKLLALNPVEKQVLLRSLVVLAWVRWTLATRSFAAVEARIARTVRSIAATGENGSAPANVCGAADVARLLLAAQRGLPWQSTCLHVAAALRLLLAERGIASELRFGVRHEGETFIAHAWLECGGLVLVGGADVYERYAAFPVARGSERELVKSSRS